MHKSKKLFFLVLFFSFLSSNFFFANVDDLFDEPLDDIDEESENIDYKSLIESDRKFNISGSFSITTGMSIGWENYDFDLFKYSFGLNAEASLNFDIRPDPYIRIVGKFTTEVEPDTIYSGWGGIQLDNLYLDYNLLDIVFFSFGNFPVKWGQGVLFDPANLLDGIEDSFNFRVAFPTFLDGLNFIMYLRANVDPEDIFSLENLYFAANIDKVVKNMRFSLGATGNEFDGIQSYFGYKIAFYEFEFASDFCAVFTNIAKDNFAVSFKVLTGVYYDWKNFGILLEYFYDHTDPTLYSTKNIQLKDHNIGATVTWRNIFNSPFNLIANAQHTFSDNTGGALLFFAFSPFPYVNVRFGFPFLWGKDEGRYTQSVLKKQPIWKSVDTNTEFYQNLDKRASFFLSITLSRAL
ncbi:MAG: hypothetical protein ACRC5H_07655 [Treponemataceae bacterium]